MSTTNDCNHENLPETTFGATEVGRTYLTTRGHEVTVTEIAGDHAIVETGKGKVMRVPGTQVCHGPIPVDGNEPAPEPVETATDDQEPTPKRKRDMTIEELQAEYLRVIGRETGSTDRRYLMWKLNEAAKGRIKVGLVEKRPARDKADMQVLPLGMERSVVAKLEAAWKALGYKNRMAFIRDALVERLRGIVESEDTSAAVAL